MIRRLFRRMFKLALVIGAAAALYKVAQARRPSPLPAGTGNSWQPAPGAPVVPLNAEAAPPVAAWIAPEGDTCPVTHPVKAKMSSSIYHLPGMAAYERTKPDRCYRDEATAEADGLRRAKR